MPDADGAPRILVLAYRALEREPRALRQILALRGSAEVTTAAVGATGIPGLAHVELPARPQRWGPLGRLLYLAFLTLRMYRALSWVSAQDHAVRSLLGDSTWDLVLAHDVQTAQAADALRSRRGVVMDLHEFAPRQGEDSRAWRLLIAPYFRWLCRKVVPRATATTTVSAAIVDAYRRDYGIECTLVVNATTFHDLAPGPVTLPIRLVHSGVAAPPRRLDILVDAVLATSADVTLDFYLTGGDGEYGQHLQMRAAGDERIRFHDAVPYAELVPTLNHHDVGVHVLPPANVNHLWALPNKLFDYVQARLGVVIGPSPEMARVVGEAGIGVVTADFTAEALARTLESLSPAQVAEWKAAANAAAPELSGERQMEIVRSLVDRVLETGHA